MEYNNKSEPKVRLDIDTTICCRNYSPTLTPPVILIDKDGDLVYKETQEGQYRVGTHSFTLNDNLLLYNGLSIELPTHRTITPIERLWLGLGFSFTKDDTAFDLDAVDADFKAILYILTTMALKDMKLISGSFTQSKQQRYGEHVFESYLLAVAGSGTIKARNRHIRFLNEEDTKQLKAQLFTTSNYQAGVRSMEYIPTATANALMQKVFAFLDTIIFKRNDIVLQPLDFVVTKEQLHQIRLRDVMLLLSCCTGYNDGFIIRPKITDNQYSRVYSVFASISSDTRTLLGFKNYDIGSALQTICLQLVDNPSRYPLHQELMNDKDIFRQKVMIETGNDLKWAKKELSKANNLDNMPKRYKQYPTLEVYYKEAVSLREEVIQGADATILERAEVFAKPKWHKKWVKGKKEPEFIAEGVKESSLFFFIWTQWERQIREAMMNCFNAPEACHQVHDAVYSREEVDMQVLEQAVLEVTGFKVKISL